MMSSIPTPSLTVPLGFSNLIVVKGVSETTPKKFTEPPGMLEGLTFSTSIGVPLSSVKLIGGKEPPGAVW